jgi:hypothetical protein
MRVLLGLLLPVLLTAQGTEADRTLNLDLRTDLGSDPMVQIRLVPPGCWDGLLLGTVPRPLKQSRRGAPGATVEVWDLASKDSERATSFALYLEGLKQRLSKAMAAPPPSHGALELGDFMQSDSTQPQKLDLTKVKSMQERFNQLPPNGSPVKRQ